MITKMLLDIFQAIVEDPFIRKMLGNYDEPKSEAELEKMMDELGLQGEQRLKFRQAYRDYRASGGADSTYQYKYEPKSDNPFDKFDAYYQKFEDYAKKTEEQSGAGTGDYRHRQYQQYRYNTGGGSQQNNNTNGMNTPNAEEKKHYEVLEVKIGASFEEIKTAYKAAMKKYHPDKFSNAEQKKAAENLSTRINQAYDFFKKKFNQK